MPLPFRTPCGDQLDVVLVAGLHEHIVDVDLKNLVDEVMEDQVHGALAGGAGVLQSECHYDPLK